MLTNTERQQIVEEVNAGTYGIDEALDDIAAAQKGEEVRKALYAEALVLNREGHAGSTDMIARQQIANLQTSVNGQISTLRTEVGEDIDDLEAALNSGLATQNGKIAAQDASIANVVANYNVEYGSTELWASTGETGALAAGTTVTLSEDVSHFDYIDIYSFCGNSNVLDTVPVDAKLQSNAGYALRWVNLSDPGSGTYEAYVRIVETKIKIIGTTLTIVHQVTYRNGSSVTISGAEITQSNRSTYVGELGIMKVVGRKITANTEIEDVRIGADGTEYASAGQAVRAQIEDVENAIPTIDTTLSYSGAAADAAAVGEALRNVSVEDTGVPSSVRQAIAALLSSAAYITTGLTDEMALVQSWAQEVTSITISPTTLSVNGGATGTIAVSTTPAGGAVTWTSSDTSIATVSSSGVVSGVSNGTCTITASSGGKTATCAVTVSGFATLTGITAVYTQSVVVYDTDTLDSLKNDLSVTASYDDSSTAVIPAADYTLSGTLSRGTSTITVSYGGQTATFTVTVSGAMTQLTRFADIPWTSGTIDSNGDLASDSTKAVWNEFIDVDYASGYAIMSGSGVTQNNLTLSEYDANKAFLSKSTNASLNYTHNQTAKYVKIEISSSITGDNKSLMKMTQVPASVLSIANTNLDTSGNEESQNGRDCSDYIDITAYTSPVFAAFGVDNVCVICFYDANQTFISRYAATTNKVVSNSVPSNAKYIRIAGTTLITSFLL